MPEVTQEVLAREMGIDCYIVTGDDKALARKVFW